MLLDSTAGCPGANDGHTVARICVACDRYLRGAQSLTPAAVVRGGEWHCDERRHGSHCAPSPAAATPCGVGGAGRQVGGCA